MLEVKNVSYAYKTKKDKTILNNVSATFEEGIFYTIVGPSGAGKTTLLSLLAGLDTAVKGTVLCNGEDITKKGLNYHRKHNISLVFQNYNLTATACSDCKSISQRRSCTFGRRTDGKS